RIAVDVDRARSAVTLHAADLRVERAAAEVDGRELRARVSVQRADETITLRFPRALPAGRGLPPPPLPPPLSPHPPRPSPPPPRSRRCPSRGRSPLSPRRGGPGPPPHPALLRRAGFQGAVPRLRDRGGRRRGRLERAGRARGAGPRRAHRALRRDAAALDLSP